MLAHQSQWQGDLDNRRRSSSLNLKSQAELSTIFHVVEALLCNSLEARATDVAVHIDFDNFQAKISDNGNGILPDTLPACCTNTSSAKPSSLAAVCEQAVVEVTSRAKGSFSTYSAVFRGGRLLKSGLATEQRSSHGTVVTVRDLFYNRPVQRKAIVNNGLHKELEKCRKIVESLSLVRPNTTFILYDVSKKRLILKLLKGRDQQTDIERFFGNPQPLDSIVSVPLSRELDCSVTGWTVVPPKGHTSTSRQQLYVNTRPATSPAISKLLASLFSDAYTRALKLETAGGFTRNELQSLRKGSNRHPMYILHIQVPRYSVFVDKEPNSVARAEFEDLDTVLSAVQEAVLGAWKPALGEAMLRAFESGILDSNNNTNSSKDVEMKPQRFGGGNSTTGLLHRHSAPGRLLLAAVNAPNNNNPSFIGLNSYEDEVEIDRLLNRNVADIEKPSKERKRAKMNDGRSLSSGLSSRPVRASAGAVFQNLNRTDNGDNSAASYHHKALHNHNLSSRDDNEGGDGPLDWHARQQWLIQQGYKTAAAVSNAAVYQNINHPNTDPPPSKWRQTKPSSTSDNNSTSFGPENRQKKTNWDNNAPTEEAIANTTAAASTGLQSLLASWQNPALMPSSLDSGITTVDKLADYTFVRLQPTALSRQQLHTARALHQVDTKFIPIVCNNVLAIVDQHAADERVRLERLKSEYISLDGRPINARAFQLPTPQPFDLGPEEENLLEAYGALAFDWGWRWAHDKNIKTSRQENRVMYVTHVPLICGTALRATDLRLYLFSLDETGAAVGTLPAGVVRVLNSKACRGAVMFGDELVPAQCEELVESLKETQLCFICAHGRPTCAPLIDLGALDRALAVKRAGGGGGGILEGAGERRSRNSRGFDGLVQHKGVGLKEKLLNDLEYDIKITSEFPLPITLSNKNLTITAPGAPVFFGPKPLNFAGSRQLNLNQRYPIIDIRSNASLELANLDIRGIKSMYDSDIVNTAFNHTPGSCPTCSSSWVYPAIITSEPGAAIVLNNSILRPLTRSLANCESDTLNAAALQYATIFGGNGTTGTYSHPPSIWINANKVLTFDLVDSHRKKLGSVPLEVAGGVTYVCALYKNSSGSSGSSDLSAGAWVGIGFGIAAGVGLVLLALALLWKRWKQKGVVHKKKEQANDGDLLSIELGGGENHRYSSTDGSDTMRLPVTPTSLEQLWRQQSDLAMQTTLRVRFGGLEGLELGHLIGRGAHGRIYKGSLRGAVVAIKVVEHTMDAELSSLDSIRSESLLMTALSHPNLLRIYRCVMIDLQKPEQASTSFIGEKESIPLTEAAVEATSYAIKKKKEIQDGPTFSAETVKTGQESFQSSEGTGSAFPVQTSSRLWETWLVLEYMERGSLYDAIRRRRFHPKNGPRRVEMIISLLADVAEGMRYLHDEAGIVHGDLKLANVLLKSGPQPGSLVAVVADFGLSRVLEDNETSVLRTQSLGTVEYMSPELLSQGKLSKACDIWAYGIMMIEMWTGRLVFSGMSAAQIVFQLTHQRKQVETPCDCPEEYREVLECCLEFDPEKRCKFSHVLKELRKLQKRLKDLA